MAGNESKGNVMLLDASPPPPAPPHPSSPALRSRPFSSLGLAGERHRVTQEQPDNIAWNVCGAASTGIPQHTETPCLLPARIAWLN